MLAKLLSSVFGFKTAAIACGVAFILGATIGAMAMGKLKDDQIAKIEAQHKKAQQAAVDAALRLAAKRQAITTKAETKAVEAQEVIRWRTRTLLKETTRYVTREADSRCVVSVGAVRLYNAAARGELPRTPAGPDGPAGRAPDAP